MSSPSGELSLPITHVDIDDPPSGSICSRKAYPRRKYIQAEIDQIGFSNLFSSLIDER